MSVRTLYNRIKSVVGQNLDEADLQDGLTDFVVMLQKPVADAAAADESTIGAFKAPYQLQIVSITVCPHGALTGHGTNNAVITLARADGAGGSPTTVATLTTTANWIEDQFVELTLADGADLIFDGRLLTLKITKGGTGVAVPAS